MFQFLEFLLFLMYQYPNMLIDKTDAFDYQNILSK